MRLEEIVIPYFELALKNQAKRRVQFPWLINIPRESEFKALYPTIMQIFEKLGGDISGLHRKAEGFLPPDVYFSEPHNFILEIDELQHFNQYRRLTLQCYPADIRLGFDLEEYVDLCQRHNDAALDKGPDRYRRPTVDFPFPCGRAAQRAFFDAFRDLLPTLWGLKPTIRVTEFELKDIFKRSIVGEEAIKHISNILEMKTHFL